MGGGEAHGLIGNMAGGTAAPVGAEALEELVLVVDGTIRLVSAHDARRIDAEDQLTGQQQRLAVGHSRGAGAGNKSEQNWAQGRICIYFHVLLSLGTRSRSLTP